MTDRATLIADAESWTTRDDLSSDIESILRVAQATINRRIRLRDQEVTTTLAASSRNTALPSDYLSMRSISLDSALDRNVDYLTPERIREAPIWNNQGGGLTDNTAGAYTIEGANIVLAPEPTAAAPVTLDIVYFSLYASLDSPTDSNPLIVNHYDAYLWPVCSAVGTWAEDDDMEAKYMTKFNGVVDEILKHERRARFSGAAMVSTGSPRHIV